VLLDRATGTLTVPGNAYHTRISAAIRAMEEATAAQRSAARGEAERGLVIWCSAGFRCTGWRGGCPISRGAGAQPGALVVDLRSTDNEPDFTRGEADGDIRYQLDSDHATPPRGIRTEELARPPVFPWPRPKWWPARPPIWPRCWRCR
jgi:DNA-binding transcriptional LysR family regulator